MADLDKGILAYESNLSDEARQQLRRLRHADVVIGIPTHRNSRTLGEVVRAVSRGIAEYLPGERVLLLNADGGSSDNTTRHVTDASLPPNATSLATVYNGASGKGAAIRAILEAAGELGAKACLVVEARAPGIEPEWIPALVTPVLLGHDVALGSYQRSAWASSLTDNLAYPFMRAILGADLRDPLASEFCVSGDLATELAGDDVWETDVARFGYNAWMSGEVLASGRSVAQVDLGVRGDGSAEPGVLADARLLHVIGTLFRLLAVHRRLWEGPLTPRSVPYVGGRTPDCALPSRECDAELLEAFRGARETYGREWQSVLLPETLARVDELLALPAKRFAFPLELWARLTFEFALVYNKGEGDPDRVAEALIPLYYARTAAWLRETSDLSVAGREQLVEQMVQAFVAERGWLNRSWNEYQPFIDPLGYDLS